VRCDCLISRAWIGGPARSGLDGYWAREGTGDRCFVAGVNCGVCKHLVPPFLFYCLVELFGMLLVRADIAWASADSLLSVELLSVITDLVIVYFLIVIVRLIVVWVGIYSFRVGLRRFRA
jgi:hypothetical protein